VSCCFSFPTLRKRAIPSSDASHLSLERGRRQLTYPALVQGVEKRGKATVIPASFT